MSVRNGLLALLTTGPRHGYELKKELEERTGSLWELNVGQVYTTLSRLERDGLVEEQGTPGAVGADEGAKSGGPDQRQYSLTAAGRNEVGEWFAAPRLRSAPDRDELVIKLTLAASLDGHVSSDGGRIDLDEIIDAQRAATIEALQTYTRLKARAEGDDLARLFALDAVIAQIDGELRWLDQCQQRHTALRATRARSSGPSRPTRRTPAGRSPARPGPETGATGSRSATTPATPAPPPPRRSTRNRGKGST